LPLLLQISAASSDGVNESATIIASSILCIDLSKALAIFLKANLTSLGFPVSRSLPRTVISSGVSSSSSSAAPTSIFILSAYLAVKLG
jgi:hypothetical protein